MWTLSFGMYRMWVIYSLLTAFFLASSDALTKRALSSRDEYFVACGRLVFSLPLLLVCLLFTEVPPLDKTFWTAVICALPLEIIAFILYTRALKVSPISLTTPFLALTPVFLILISYVIVGEKVSISGGAGILLMAAGGYTLHIHKIKQTVLEPFMAIFRERGSRLMIIAAFIYSITASLGKIAIEHSSPIFFGSFYFIIVTFLFIPIAFVKNRSGLALKKKDLLPLFMIGFTFSLMIIFHMIAMSLTNVAYMIAVKRTSLLFSIMYGYFLFKEENIGEKMAGGVLMLAGFVLVISGS